MVDSSAEETVSKELPRKEGAIPSARWPLTNHRVLARSVVLFLLLAPVVFLWLTIDEPLSDQAQSWLGSDGPLDEESFELLETFSKTPEFLRGHLGYKDFSQAQRRLMATCALDISTCFRLALDEPERISPLVPDNPEYWHLYDKIESRRFGQIIDRQIIAPLASIIPPVSNRLLRELLDHGKVDHERLLATINTNRQQLIESSSMFMALAFTATLQLRLSHLGVLLGNDQTRTPELLELTGYEQALSPIGEDEWQQIAWFQGDLRYGYDLYSSDRAPGDLFYKRNADLNRQVNLFEYLESFLKLPDEKFWQEDPEFPGYSLTDKMVDPLGHWRLVFPTYETYLTMFRITNQHFRLSLARQRIYQGASPASHGVLPATGWEWKFDNNELCLVPDSVHPNHVIDYPLCSTINLGDTVSDQAARISQPSVADPG